MYHGICGILVERRAIYINILWFFNSDLHKLTKACEMLRKFEIATWNKIITKTDNKIKIKATNISSAYQHCGKIIPIFIFRVCLPLVFSWVRTDSVVWTRVSSVFSMEAVVTVLVFRPRQLSLSQLGPQSLHSSSAL